MSISILGPPSPPSGVQVVPMLDVSPTSVTLRWTDGPDNGLPISSYRVEALTHRWPAWLMLTTLPASATQPFFGKRSLALPNSQLQPWNSYRFRVFAGNDMGFSGPSMASSTFDVPVTPPTRPPVAIIGGGGRAGVLRITWSSMPPHEENAPGIGYKVYYRKLNSTTFQVGFIFINYLQ